MATDKKQMVDWVEAQGQRCVEFVVESLDKVRSEATTTLSILLAGAGACFFLAIEKWGCDDRLVGSLLAVVVYLFGLSGVVVWKCLLMADVYPPANDPGQVYSPGCDLLEMREAELRLLSQRIQKNTELNQRVGSALNWVRRAMVVTPIIFAGAWVAASVVG